MAIIYSYPDNLNILLTDMLIGTSTIKVAGKKKNITKNFTIEALGKVISTANPTVWGTIIGSLDDQTDLQAALDSKQNNITLTTIGSNGPSTLIGSVLNIPNYFTAVPTKTSELINDGEDGVNPFITAADVTPQVNSDWDAASGVAEILNKPIIPTKTSDLTNDGEDGINPFITLADIPPSTIPNLNDVLLEGNISELDAKIGELYLFDTVTGAYAKMSVSDQFFALDRAGGGTMLTVDNGNNLALNNGIAIAQINNNLIVSRTYTLPDASGIIALTSDIPTQGLTSVGLTMPVAFNVANSPLTSDGTIAVSAAGTSSQYIRGDGQLATLPSGGGGGSSVNYYLNGSIAASVATYKQLSNTAIIGGGTDFTLTGNGLITQFLTDVGNPNRIEIPGGAWNFEMWFSMSSNGGTPKFYVELLKYNGTTFTTIANSSAVPETINGGTVIDLYLTSLAVPTTTLLSTDRLAIRVYIVNNSGGRTATLHTEDTHLCEILTTFSGGVTSLNGLTANTQYLAVGTTGTDFNINSVSETHTFNLPTASATNRGALSTTDWSAFNGKFTLPALTSGSVLFSNGTTIAQDNANFFWDDTNNRLGIGTTAPTQKLDVIGNIGMTGQFEVPDGVVFSNYTSGSLASIRTKGIDIGLSSAIANYGVIETSTTYGISLNINGATKVKLDGTTGNVGIGTTAPGAKLQVVGNINLQIAESTITNTTIGLITDAGRVQSYIQFLKTNAATDRIGEIAFFTNDGGAFTAGIERMRINSTGLVGIGMTPTAKLTIKAPGALSTDIALRVRNSADSGDLLVTNGLGNVGIGTATPNQKLEVIGNAIFRSTSRIDINTAQTAVVGVLAGTSLGTYGNFSLISNTGLAGESTDISYWNGGTYYPAFRISNVASGFSKLLLMKDGGNVGIGTTAPTSKLQVVGLVDYATNALAIAGGLTVGAFYHTAGVVKVVI